MCPGSWKAILASSCHRNFIPPVPMLGSKLWQENVNVTPKQKPKGKQAWCSLRLFNPQKWLIAEDNCDTWPIQSRERAVSSYHIAVIYLTIACRTTKRQKMTKTIRFTKFCFLFPSLFFSTSFHLATLWIG